MQLDKCGATGSRQGQQQRLTEWLASLWRPAPYPYLDHPAVLTADRRRPAPPASAFHVSQDAAMDPQLFSADSSSHAEQSSGPSDDLHTSAAALHAEARPEAQQWQQHQQQGACSSDEHPSGWGPSQDLMQQGNAAQLSLLDGSRQRGRSGRWRWLRRFPRRHHSNSNSPHCYSNREDQREMVRNVKAVLPYLSDEVILAELECVTDANQAVENLLCRT